jgi:ubiquinone/menaquinone biosynthesis C-methylase UbiE
MCGAPAMTRSRQPRVDYDAIAAAYDAQPYRERAADPQLLAFVEEREPARLSVLDIGCGTGNQLIADRGALPQIRYVGLDRSSGMLRQARRKAPGIGWVRADGAGLPFAAGSFDFVCCQFAFHHVREKPEMLRQVFRALRPGGQFAMRNLCPQESADWLYYRYFPEAQLVDLQDFWPVEAVLAVMEAAGFVAAEANYEHIRFEQNLPAWLETVRHRETCSQLQAISEAAYLAGVERLERDVADAGAPQSRHDHLCLVTVCGEAPSGTAS